MNFYAKVHERTEVRPDPSFSAAYGYYGYRYGLYGAWPLYDNDVRTVTYPIGTANIDVVDARKKQMIWEGVAQGRLHDEDMDNPRESISQVVTQLFARFPGRAGIIENSRQSDAPVTLLHERRVNGHAAGALSKAPRSGGPVRCSRRLRPLPFSCSRAA